MDAAHFPMPFFVLLLLYNAVVISFIGRNLKQI